MLKKLYEIKFKIQILGFSIAYLQERIIVSFHTSLDGRVLRLLYTVGEEGIAISLLSISLILMNKYRLPSNSSIDDIDTKLAIALLSLEVIET